MKTDLRIGALICALFAGEMIFLRWVLADQVVMWAFATWNVLEDCTVCAFAMAAVLLMAFSFRERGRSAKTD